MDIEDVEYEILRAGFEQRLMDHLDVLVLRRTAVENAEVMAEYAPGRFVFTE